MNGSFHDFDNEEDCVLVELHFSTGMDFSEVNDILSALRQQIDDGGNSYMTICTDTWENSSRKIDAIKAYQQVRVGQECHFDKS